MRDILEIWDELFEAAPSPAEEEVMRNLAQLVDPQDTSFILCAIVVRFLTQSLLLDSSSPVNLAGRLGQGLDDLRDRADRLDNHLTQFDDRLHHLRAYAFQVTEALRDARNFAMKSRKIHTPKFEFGPEHWSYSLAPITFKKLAITAFLGSLAGSFLTGLMVIWLL